MSHHIVTVPCLGRSFHLGSLYDCRTDTLLNEALWDENAIQSAVQTKLEGSETVDIITANNLGDKMKALEFNPGLRLNMLSGSRALSSTGISGPIVDYLQEERPPNDHVRIHFRYATTSNIEEVDPYKIKGQCSNAPSKQATHVVYKVQYGTDAFFAFDCQVKADETHAEVQRSMKEVMESLKHRIFCANSENKTPERVIALDSKQAEKYECKYYHSESGDSSPMTLKHVADVKELCTDHSVSGNASAVSKWAWLLPLSQLGTKHDTNRVNEVSEMVATQVQKLLEDVDNQHIMVGGLMRQHCDFLSKVKTLHSDLCKFQELVKSFSSRVKGRIRWYLPKVLSGNANEKELIENVDKSPFHPDCLSKWLDQKKKQIELFCTITNALPPHGIEFVESIPQSDTYKKVDSVVYFVCNVTQKGDVLLDAMKEHMQVKQQGDWLKETGSDEVLTKVSECFKLFTAYAESNKSKGNIKFVVVECNYDYSSDCGSTVLSSHGKRQAFQLPSKPGTPRIKSNASITHNSIHLQWTKPGVGSENIAYYNVYYRPLNQNPNQHWSCSRTIDSNEYHTVNQLDSRKKYMFKVCPVLQYVPNIICVESDHVLIDVAKSSFNFQAEGQDTNNENICQPGRPRATSVTHNKITLEWSKPKHGREHVQMYIVSYCLWEANDGDWESIPPQTDSECELVEKMTIGKDFLKSNKKYVFKVKPLCFNPDIEVEESEMSHPVETVPVCQPGKPTAVVVTHNSIKLEWSKPMFGGESVDLYMVHYRKYDELQGKWSMARIKSTPNPQQTATIKGLELNVQYVFKVTPFSSKSTLKNVSSEESDPIQTEQGCQTGKPKVLTVTHNSITITWDKPEHWSNQINFYRVYCHQTDKPEDKPITEIAYSTNLKLSNLELGAKYIFWVKPDCADKGVKTMNSEVSDEIETKPSCQPGKPQATSTTHDSVSLKWDKPEYNYENVELYSISYSSINCDGNIGEWSRQKTKSSQERIDVKGLRLGENYVFKVEAVCRDEGCNVVESEQSDIIVTKTTSKPGKPMCSNVQHDKVDVKWKHPEHGYRNVQSYNVTYSIMDASSSTSTSTEMSHINVPLSTNCATVMGLTSNLKYCFKVTPVCQNGDGMESDTSDPVQTLPVCQTGKPAVSNITHNSVILTWEKPGYRSDQVRRYSILCDSLSIQKGAKSGANQKRFETKRTETSITLSSLEMDTEYTFRVIPVCMDPKVISVQSEESKTRTRAASVPANFKCGAITHDSVQLKWSKPKHKIRSQKISSYRLSYRAVDDPENVWKTSSTETKAEDKITVDDLIASTKYEFKVCAIYATEDQEGADSDVITIETKPSCKPSKIQVTHVSHNTVQLQWTHPEHFARTVQHYIISYCKSESVDEQWKTVIAQQHETESTIKNLDTNTSYVFTVEPTCNSKKIITQSTECKEITTKATSKPGTPRAHTVSHDSVGLAWEMPQYGQQNVSSFVILYHSTLEPDEGEWHKQESDGSQTSVIVTELSLNSVYVFKVYPKCVSGEGVESDVSSPIQTKATSPPSKPQVIEVTHNSITLSWKRPEHGSIGVKDYTVVSCSTDAYTHIESIATTQESVTMTGLLARTSYAFKVIPNCEDGTGSESEYSDLVETKPSCKPSLPKAGTVTHESVELKWSKPDFQGNAIKHYRISYWNVNSPHLNVSELNTNGQQESVTIQGLFCNTTYKFEVTPCCTDSETGTESSSAVITTKATSKPGTPYAIATAHNCVELNWSKPEYGGELVDSYTVSCRLENSSRWINQETNGSQENIVFKGLRVNEKYVFKVQSKPMQGEGSESDSSDTVITRATSPPGTPYATDVTHNSVELQWFPPNEGFTNVSAYTVSYRSTHQLNTEWQTQTSSDTSVSITGLALNTSYIFKVNTECKLRLVGSESNPSEYIETKATSKPGVPQVILSTNDSVRLEWNKPERGSENIKSYIVLCHNNDSDPNDLEYESMNLRHYNTNSSSNNAIVSGLTVKTQYVFSVVPECFSGTGYASDNSDLYWTKATSQPGIPEPIRVTHDAVQLRWSKPVHGSENVERYVISCCEVSSPLQASNKRIFMTKGAVEYGTVFELQPGSSYIFSVKCECTDSVEGMESDFCQLIKTKLTSPPGKPRAVYNEITHNTVSVEWDKPQIGHEFVKHYSVYYKEFDAPSDQWIVSTQSTSSRDDTVVTVSQLTPKTKYVFKVEPVCDIGMGSESKCSDVIITKPSSKAGKPFATFIGHDAVCLQWDKPEYGSEYIEKYIVSFWATSQLEKEFERKGTKECSLQISKLSPNTEYIFQVYPKFKSGLGSVCSDTSDPILTTATSKPGKPRLLKVTHDSVELKWNEPQHGKSSILYYSIRYQELQGSDWFSDSTKHTLTQGSVSGLKPTNKYIFKLCIFCKEGEGPESETSNVIQTKATSPPSPPTASLGGVTHSSIQLKWSKPRIVGSDIISYSVFCRKSGAKSLEWNKKHATSLSLTLNDLHLNTKYDFYVQAECQTGSGAPSKTISIQTKATSKPEKLVSSLVLHDTVHLKWSKPKHGAENIYNYILSYQPVDDQQAKWIKVQLPNGPSEFAVVPGLTPSTRYVFKLLPQCKTGAGSESEMSQVIKTRMTSEPGKPEPYDVGHNSLSLRWTLPKYGSDLVTGYIVYYKEVSSESDWKRQECDINDTVVGGLTPGKKYTFKVQPKCNKLMGARSETSDPIETKSTSPPGKPTVSEANDSITHDSITIRWKAPIYGAENITGYTIYYHTRDDSVDTWKTCKVRSPTILSQTVSKLQSNTKYIFKVSSICSAGIGAESECSEPIETKPSCKPGKPTPTDITHESVSLKWSEPEYGTVVSYNVHYIKKGGKNWMQESTTDNLIELKDLQHKTEYQVYVYPQIKPEIGMGIESSELTTIQTKHIPLAERMKKKSRLIKKGTEGSPDIYQVPIQTISENKQMMIRKCFVGEDAIQRTTFHSGKVIMIVGATGTGKTTLINGLVNHALGVKWKHSYRFKMIFEESQEDQTKSQTKWITSYTIQEMEESPIAYPLTIIDTPGFGDTEGIERDKRLVEQIRAFFGTKGEKGIDQIHAIGFATQAGLPRLTAPQKYIFHSVMSVFGKDVGENIFMLTTFADGQLPPVLKAVKDAGVPYHKAFKFNNSALFAVNSETSAIDKMFWEMGNTSFTEFFVELSKTTPKSLTLTKEVLEERENLEVCIEGLQQQVRLGLSKIDTLQQEEQILKKHEAQLRLNQDFSYTIEVTKQRKVDLDPGQYVTNCLTCNSTCHFPCYIPRDDEKHSCAAMGANRGTNQAQCTVCPGKCIWNVHVNNPYRFELYVDHETKTSEDLKQRFHSAKGGKVQVENMIAELNQDLDEWYKDVFRLIRRTQQSLERLQEIALKPNPLTEVGYIDLLIEAEKQEAKPGYLQRIQALEQIKEKAKLLKKIPQEKFDPNRSGSGRRLLEGLLQPEM